MGSMTIIKPDSLGPRQTNRQLNSSSWAVLLTVSGKALASYQSILTTFMGYGKMAKSSPTIKKNLSLRLNLTAVTYSKLTPKAK